MMQLMLLRHGKSDWGADAPDRGHGSDHERPLKPRGVRAAELAGRLLTAMDLEPATVLSSTAVRARTTAELARAAGGWAAEVETTPALYLASIETALDVVRGVDDSGPVLMVGHEPTWSTLTAALVGDRRATVRVVTGALVGIELGIARWADIAPSRGQLSFLLPPRRMERVV